VIGPRESGVRSIWFNEGGRHPEPPRAYPTITRLPDAVPLIDGIRAPD
jgi:FMN phosphatase YigB (HAD superfamily)